MPAEFPPMPDADEAMRIAEHIWRIAGTLIDDPDQAKSMVEEWIVVQPLRVARLRLHYVAVTAPLLASGILRKHITPGPDEMFALTRTPDAGHIPAVDAVAQALVRFLNNDEATAHGILDAAIATGGDEALFDMAMEGLGLLRHMMAGAKNGTLRTKWVTESWEQRP